MTQRYVLLGIDDDVTSCDHCGKTLLKCTVVLSQLDADGNEVAVVRFGRDCAARALGRRRTADKMELEARTEAAQRASADFRTWPRRTIGDGWAKMTLWIGETYAVGSTCFHERDIRHTLNQYVTGVWRYVGTCPMGRVFQKEG